VKVLAINGSPRKNGNTKILIETVFKPLTEAGIETELYQK
jgi:multimeric flavodoxin WrbA